MSDFLNELEDAEHRDLAGLLENNKAVWEHWEEVKLAYPSQFQEYFNGVVVAARSSSGPLDEQSGGSETVSE